MCCFLTGCWPVLGAWQLVLKEAGLLLHEPQPSAWCYAPFCSEVWWILVDPASRTWHHIAHCPLLNTLLPRTRTGHHILGPVCSVYHSLLSSGGRTEMMSEVVIDSASNWLVRLSAPKARYMMSVSCLIDDALYLTAFRSAKDLQ